MLQRVEAEVGQLRRFGVAVDAEDAALVAELVEHSFSGTPRGPCPPSCCSIAVAHACSASATASRPPPRRPRPPECDRRRSVPITAGRHAGCAGRRQHRLELLGRRRDDDARRRLAEQRRVHLRSAPIADRAGDVGGDADAAAVEAALGQRDGQAAFGAIVRRFDQAVADRGDDQLLQRPLRASRSSAGRLPATMPCRIARYSLPPSSPRLSPSSTTPAPACLNVRVTVFERILEQPDHAQHGRRKDGAAFGFVVQADVAAGDRDAERAAGVADAAHGFGESAT